MLLDALLQLSSAQAVTASAVSTNTIDLSQARDMGPGEDLYAVFGVDTTALAAGAATVTFNVITADSADLATNQTVVASTGPIGKAALTAGRAPISVCIPPHTLERGQRYMGVSYTVGTGPLTAGAFTAYISNTEVHGQKNYPSGFAVV